MATCIARTKADGFESLLAGGDDFPPLAERCPEPPGYRLRCLTVRGRRDRPGQRDVTDPQRGRAGVHAEPVDGTGRVGQDFTLVDPDTHTAIDHDAPSVQRRR